MEKNRTQSNSLSRRDFLKLIKFAIELGLGAVAPLLGVVTAALLHKKFPEDAMALFSGSMGSVLAACGSGGVPEAQPIVSPELQPLVDSGAYSEPLYQEAIRAEQSNLSPSAKRSLYAFLGSKAGEQMLQAGWEKVATPQFLYEQGVVVGDDISEIFRFKQRNGGFLFFDQANNRYLKVAPEGVGTDAAYLRYSKNYYTEGWRAMGIPEETVAKVQLVEGFQYEGKQSVLLVTPNMNQTLETYTAFLKGNKVANADAILGDLLQRYYVESLLPMNAAGIYQADPNFKNICLYTQADGSVKLVPIDLAQKPVAFEKSAIFQTQYEELVARAGRRSIKMPSYSEFLLARPDIAQQIGLIEGLGETVRINMSLPGEAQKVLLLVPQKMIGGAGQAVITEENIVASLTKQYGEAYKTIPQGQVFSATVQTEAGEVTIGIIKANAVGDTVTAFGGKWAKFLELGKAGLRTAGDILLLMWIADEIGQVTDPDYVATLHSTVAFPDSVNSLDNARTFLESIYSILQLSKQNLARKAVDPRIWTPLMEQMFGMTNMDFLNLITEGYMTQSEIGMQLAEIAPIAAFPPASSEIKFQSPFPILIPAAEYPMSAMFSAYDDDANNQVVLFWAQTENTEGKLVTIPISQFTKKPGEDKWETVNLIDAPWSVEFAIDQETKVFACTKSASSDRSFELQCVKK